jgi:hypothetical protein
MQPTAFAATEINLSEILDLDRYPIHAIGDAARTELVTEAREAMLDTGCFRVRDFVRPEAIEAMAAEAASLHDQTFWSVQDHNPYFSPDDESFPEHHPRRTFQHRQSGFINSDLLTEQSLLRKIYDADVLVHFVWECLGTPQPIYRWADPLGRNPCGVMEPTHYLPWHFDGNEFAVSILVQKADEGGVFEYVPNIRTPEAENYEHIQHILDGGRDGVHELDLQPGDLQLFAGRFSMHRVTRIVGDTTRYIGLPTYVHDPYRMNRPYHSESIYGRATEMHHERANVLVDGLVD